MKKNIIILHTDQQRYDSLSCNGNKSIETPNIDSLAQDGCNFSRHISTNPTCMPSRSSLLTGLYVPGHGVCSNGIPLWRRGEGGNALSDKLSIDLFGEKVQDKVPTIADILGENGYKTALFGKIHVQPHQAHENHGFYESYTTWENPERENENKPYYGFQTNKIILGHGEMPTKYNMGHYGRWLNRKHPKVMERLNNPQNRDVLTETRGDIFLSDLPAELHNTMWLADETCEYIKGMKDDDEPTMMFVGFPDPHHPFTPPKDISEGFENIPTPEFSKEREIKGKPSSITRDIIKSRQASDEDCKKAYQTSMVSIKLLDRAVGQIIDELKRQGMYDNTIIIFTSDHGDYLGDLNMLTKNDLAFHNLVHLPFILKGTKEDDLPETMDRPMSNADVVPTLLSMVGVDRNKNLQGIDIFGDDHIQNKPMITCFGVVRDFRNISIYDETYRYTYFLDTKEEELYNHKTDPKELNNLVNDPEVDVTAICRTFKAELLAKHVDSDLGIYNHYSLW